MTPTARVLVWVVLLSTLLVARESLSQPIGIVALGDSNTAGFGIGRDQAFDATCYSGSLRA